MSAVPTREVTLACGDTISVQSVPAIGAYRFCIHCDSKKRVTAIMPLPRQEATMYSNLTVEEMTALRIAYKAAYESSRAISKGIRTQVNETDDAIRMRAMWAELMGQGAMRAELNSLMWELRREIDNKMDA